MFLLCFPLATSKVQALPWVIDLFGLSFVQDERSFTLLREGTQFLQPMLFCLLVSSCFRLVFFPITLSKIRQRQRAYFYVICELVGITSINVYRKCTNSPCKGLTKALKPDLPFSDGSSVNNHYTLLPYDKQVRRIFKVWLKHLIIVIIIIILLIGKIIGIKVKLYRQTSYTFYIFLFKYILKILRQLGRQ